MQGLLLKDFYNLKKTMGLLAVMLVVFGVLQITYCLTCIRLTRSK
ncbi:hypothetical protein [Flavonifractor sp. An112]|nr:hypothetical protein [Flavonifractor sp. An112]